jgi:short subunit dehydrogenase-like uncharacterized protein
MTNEIISADREWDLVIYGATGDAGSAIAMYVANNFDTYKKKKKNDSSRFRWAIAGRNERKLNQLRSRIIVGRSKPSSNDEIGIIISDSSSIDDMSNMAKSTRLVISAVGPYTTLGESIYSACVMNGTHYADITGEVDWVYSMREKYSKKAKETGSTLCSFAGYDSIPCDITMYLARSVLLASSASSSPTTKKDDASTTSTIYFTSAETVTQVSGGTLPKGTIRTMISKLPEGAVFVKKLIRYAGDGSSGSGGGTGGKCWKTTRSLIQWLLPRWSSEFGAFTLPHFMGWCNIPVIHNSYCSSVAKTAEEEGGDSNSMIIDCIYHDRVAVPFSQGCLGTGYGLLQTLIVYTFLLLGTPLFLCFQLFVAFVPSSAVILLKLFDSLQYSGNTQQNQKQLEDSTVEVYTYATSSEGTKAVIHMFVNGDPGIKCTAILAAETSFAMLSLEDKNKLPKGRIGSPSMIVGDELVKRLQNEETMSGCCTLSVISVIDNKNKNTTKDYIESSSKKDS